MNARPPLDVITDSAGRRLVDVEQFVAAVEREIDITEAELNAMATGYDGNVRARLEAAAADAVAAARERLAHHAELLRSGREIRA